MAYRISELKCFASCYDIGEALLVKHSEHYEGSTYIREEYCEIVGKFENHIVLQTLQRKNSQHRFSLDLYDFYNAVSDKRSPVFDYDKTGLIDLVIDPKDVYYGFDYSGFNKHSEGINGCKRVPLPVVFN